jgi:hypothetical protein
VREPLVETAHGLAGEPVVVEAVERARVACSRLARHPVLRRRGDQVRAVARAHAAMASAALDGVVLPETAFLDFAAGTTDDPAGRSARGALRAVIEAARIAGSWQAAGRPPPALQALARLHTVASTGLVPAAEAGRPGQLETAGIARLRALDAVLAAPQVPAAIAAALVQAEVSAVAPFPAATGVVARALARAVVIARGLDPTGVAVWEEGLRRETAALPGYDGGDRSATVGWMVAWAGAVAAGAEIGLAICEAVLNRRAFGT